jgi:hypothetical protein
MFLMREGGWLRERERERKTLFTELIWMSLQERKKHTAHCVFCIRFLTAKVVYTLDFLALLKFSSCNGTGSAKE